MYINDIGLSDDIFNTMVARFSRYQKQRDGFSVTELLKPPQAVLLERSKADMLIIPISTLFDAWVGHCVHDALQDDKLSRRLFKQVSGITLSGEYDYYNHHTQILKDYKRTSVWSVILDDRTIKKWEEQLNLYAYLLNPTPVKEAYIEAFFKDWNERDRQRHGEAYPRAEQVKYPIPLWAPLETQEYIVAKLGDLSRTPVRDCTPEEQWERPTTYAVMASGKKTATRVLSSKEEAEEYIRQSGRKDYIISERKGEKVRCNRFCNVRDFCPQYRRENT